MPAPVFTRHPDNAAAELRRGSAAVRVALAPGAPVTAFIVDGHDWCATGPWRDYAPSAVACSLPASIASAPGANLPDTLPDGGTLAAVEPTVDVRAEGETQEISAWWAPVPYPLGWTRAISLASSGEMCARYAVTNARPAALPFVWEMPLVLPGDGTASLQIPRARARISRATGEGMPAAGTEFAWPLMRVGERTLDVSRPTQLGEGRALLCYVELPQGKFVVRVGNRSLEVRGTAGTVTHARVAINTGGDPPAARPRGWWRSREHDAHAAFSVGPAAGAPDSLSDAVGSWGSARWIEPGDTLHWELRFRALATSATPT